METEGKEKEDDGEREAWKEGRINDHVIGAPSSLSLSLFLLQVL